MRSLFAKIITRQNEGFDKLHTNFTIDQILKFVFIQSIVNGGNKFVIMKEQFVDNKFLTSDNIDSVMEFFLKAQKVYHTLLRFVDKMAYKRARTYDYNMDMAMIPLSEYKPHMVITLLENNTKYNFKLGDLITLIQKRLCHSNNFFPEPLDIVNPYTNIPLSFRNLYKIYFKCKSSNYKLPALFHQFFLCNFDVNLFLDYNECLLKEHIIDDYVKTATERQKNRKLAAMLYHYKNFIDYRSFSQNKEAIYARVSHLLTHYLRSRYSLNPNVRFSSKRIIQNELRVLVCPRSQPFGKERTRTIYRHISPDITRYNPFVFGPLNEAISDSEIDIDDELDDDDDDVDDDVSEIVNSDELPGVQAGDIDVSFNMATNTTSSSYGTVLSHDHNVNETASVLYNAINMLSIEPISTESPSAYSQNLQAYMNFITHSVTENALSDEPGEE